MTGDRTPRSESPLGLRTGICELLGVDHPIGNAGMAGVAQPTLCCGRRIGGIGTVAMAGASPETVASRRSGSLGDRATVQRELHLVGPRR
ncbi:MAG: hypothetical protein R2789_15055 [Microthrixaceae bacterium]